MDKYLNYKNIQNSDKDLTLDPTTIEHHFYAPGARWTKDCTEFQTLNPLRNDKKVGSFYISTKGIYNDFASNESGTVFQLLSKAKGLSEKEAFEELYPHHIKSEKHIPKKPIEIFDKWYDENGNSQFIRLKRDRNKLRDEFIWEFSIDNGETWNIGKNNIKTLLYNHPILENAKYVFLVEGEGKCVHLQNCIDDNEFASTTSGSASSWSKTASNFAVNKLKGKIVFILPDNDKDGHKFAQKIYDTLQSHTIECYILELPGIKEIEILKKGKKIKEKQDIKNWLDAGNTFLDLKNYALNFRKQYHEKNIPQLNWSNLKTSIFAKTQIDILEIVFKEVLEKRYNVVLNKAEIRYRTEDFWQIVDERMFNKIWLEINQAIGTKAKSISKDYLSSYLCQKDISDFNPLKVWANSIQKVIYLNDEESELNKLLNNIVLDDPNSKELFSIVMKRWLVGFYMLTSEKITRNDICPVLSGKQGLGKNRLIEKIFDSLPSGYIETGSIQADQKDSKLKLSTMCLLHLDEFDATQRKSEVSSLKNLLSLETLNERLPYDRSATTLKRRASFIASINTETDILLDETGNRRFPTFRISDIVSEEIKTLDTLKIWGEIKYLAEELNFSPFLDRNEIEILENNNKRFKRLDLFEQYILEEYSPKRMNDKDKMLEMSINEIISEIEHETVKKHLNPVKIGRIMSSLGFEMIRKSHVRKYILYIRSTKPEDYDSMTLE